MRHLHAVVLPLLCSTAACFVRGREAPVPAPSTTTVAAVELGCPYNKPRREDNTSGSRLRGVKLAFVVLKDGSVAPSTVRFLAAGTLDPTYVQRAKDIAVQCTYKPALSNGEPVESTVKKWFYFKVG